MCTRRQSYLPSHAILRSACTRHLPYPVQFPPAQSGNDEDELAVQRSSLKRGRHVAFEGILSHWQTSDLTSGTLPVRSEVKYH